MDGSAAWRRARSYLLQLNFTFERQFTPVAPAAALTSEMALLGGRAAAMGALPHRPGKGSCALCFLGVSLSLGAGLGGMRTCVYVVC